MSILKSIAARLASRRQRKHEKEAEDRAFISDAELQEARKNFQGSERKPRL